MCNIETSRRTPCDHTPIIHHRSNTTPLKNNLIAYFGIQEGAPTKIKAVGLAAILNKVLATRVERWHANSDCLIN
ncbi:hypothetical protein HanRHA438_Chr14g0647161 [Helianthus annuus]|nr:hypothetical protein HanRHA438_Chr14g0647161 [Helianthus annuus]